MKKYVLSDENAGRTFVFFHLRRMVGVFGSDNSVFLAKRVFTTDGVRVYNNRRILPKGGCPQ